MNTIKKGLDQQVDKEKLEGQKVEELLKEAKLLLASSQQEEVSALKGVGLDREIRVIEDQTRRSLLTKQFIEKYEGNIYHRSHVVSILEKYGLVMKKVYEYRGKIPADLASHIVRVKKQDLLHLDGKHTDAGKFFIIAPPKMFDSYRGFRTKIVDGASDMKATMEQILTPKNTDPVMLYRVDPEHYLFLKAWGNDFTWFRQVIGFFKRNIPLVKSLIPLAIALLVVLDINLFTTLNTAVWSKGWAHSNGYLYVGAIIFTILTYLASLVSIIFMVVKGIFGDDKNSLVSWGTKWFLQRQAQF